MVLILRIPDLGRESSDGTAIDERNLIFHNGPVLFKLQWFAGFCKGWNINQNR